MKKIYISSSFADLVKHRQAVLSGLRKLGYELHNMEDYTAKPRPPVEVCVQDVQSCDLYVGIIAWRYGSLAPAGPDGRVLSFTEREYEAAAAAGKDRLIFLADPEASWPVKWMDSQSKEPGAGEQINRFREAAAQGKIVGFFDGPQDLSSKVNDAVTVWDREAAATTSARPAGPVAPVFREVRFSTMVAYVDSYDSALATACSQAVSSALGDPLLKSNALLAASAAEFAALEEAVVKGHTVTVVLTPPSLGLLRGRSDEVAQVLSLLQMRTGYCAALLYGVAPGDVPATWLFSEVFTITPALAADAAATAPAAGAAPNAEGLAAWNRALSQRCPPRKVRTIGLPLITLAMTRAEVDSLVDDAELIKKLGGDAERQFEKLRQALKLKQPAARERYAPSRTLWRPFARDALTLEGMLAQIVGRINGSGEQIAKNHLKLQHYPIDFVRDDRLRAIYRQIAQAGCVVVVDELSYFHPQLRELFSKSELSRSKQVALVTISPLDLERWRTNRLLEDGLRRELADAFDRFADDFDPQCEFAVGGERRLGRWLCQSLPRALRNLRDPGPSRSSLDALREEIRDYEPRGVDRTLWPEGSVE